MFSHIQQLNRFTHQSMLQRAEHEIKQKQAAASRLAHFISKLATMIPVDAHAIKELGKKDGEIDPPFPPTVRQDRVLQAAKYDMPVHPTLTSIEGYREVLANKTRIS